MGDGIDWVATASMLQGCAGLAGAAAVLTAALIGRTTYKGWLEQRRTERKLDVGERLLTLAYRAREALGAVRNPGAFGYEDRAAEEKITVQAIAHEPEQLGDLKVALITLARLQVYADLWTEILDGRTAARVFFGPDMMAELDGLLTLRNEVQIAANMYWSAQPGAFRESCEAKIWGLPGDEDDALAARMDKAVASIEAVVLPLVGGG